MSIRVLLMDDHHDIQTELIKQLERESDLQVIGTANTVRQALFMARKLTPDVLVVSLYPPDCHCLSLADQVRKQHPAVQLLVMGQELNERSLMECLKAGAMGYLAKDRALKYLVSGIRAVALKRPYFCADALEAMMKRCLSDLAKKNEF